MIFVVARKVGQQLSLERVSGGSSFERSASLRFGLGKGAAALLEVADNRGMYWERRVPTSIMPAAFR